VVVFGGVAGRGRRLQFSFELSGKIIFSATLSEQASALKFIKGVTNHESRGAAAMKECCGHLLAKPPPKN
jgi:hypothetical protein